MSNNLNTETVGVNPDDKRYAEALAEIHKQNAEILAELRALRQEQALQSKKITSKMREVDAIYRDLDEFVLSGPRQPYKRDLVHDDIEQELKDLGFKRIE